GRTALMWRRGGVSVAARRAFQGNAIDQKQLDALLEAVKDFQPPPMGREEFEELKKIATAQTVLLKCKLIDESDADRQLGSGTTARLRDVAAGNLACKSPDPA